MGLWHRIKKSLTICQVHLLVGALECLDMSEQNCGN